MHKASSMKWSPAYPVLSFILFRLNSLEVLKVDWVSSLYLGINFLAFCCLFLFLSLAFVWPTLIVISSTEITPQCTCSVLR